MRNFRISRPTQALLAANVLVALVIAFQLTYPATASQAIDTPVEDTAASLPDFGDGNVNPPGLGYYADMLERPLFYVDRRFPSPPEKKAAPPPAPLRLTLEGVAIAQGSRVAVLRNVQTRQLVQLEEGGTHDGWTLESLDAASARFTRGEQVTELLLDPATGGRR
jgi:hypothetical protein